MPCKKSISNQKKIKLPKKIKEAPNPLDKLEDENKVNDYENYEMRYLKEIFFKKPFYRKNVKK